MVLALWFRRARLAQENRLRRAQNTQLEERVAKRTKELVDAQDALVQRSKLALLGQITASIAHEINQPLGAIGNYAENAKHFIENGQLEAASSNQQKILNQAKRTSRIVDNLRTFSKADQFGLRPVVLEQILASVLSAAEDRFPGIGARVELMGQQKLVALAGQVRLEQILTNLLVNAWMEVRGNDQPQIHIDVFQAKDGAEILVAVEDNGSGIDLAVGDALFEPFVSSRDQADGLGLGLAIAKQFAQTMNGDLALVAPTRLGGARFEITLLAFTAENRKKLNVRNLAD